MHGPYTVSVAMPVLAARAAARVHSAPAASGNPAPSLRDRRPFPVHKRGPRATRRVRPQDLRGTRHGRLQGRSSLQDPFRRGFPGFSFATENLTPDELCCFI